MSKNNNPDGRGGFADNPSNINKKGRPPKGYSITEMMREMLDSKPEVKEAIGKVIAEKALEGDITAIKTLWQYMDGMPLQSHDVKSDSSITVKIEGYGDSDNATAEAETSNQNS